MQARQFSLRGADALQMEKHEDAEALFAEALRRCPTDERAHWGMAEVQWSRGNSQTATYHMEEASRMSGNNPDLLVRLGEMHLQAGRWDDAQRQAELALSHHRHHAGAWQLRGRLCEQRQQWQEAIECYHRALMSQPNNPVVQVALAEIYQRQGRSQRALATLERMADLQSSQYEQASTSLLKGQALASLGQIEEAKKCLRDAASQADPDDFRLFLQIAQLHTEVGQWAEARASLGRSLSLQPQNPEALALQQTLDKNFARLTASAGANRNIATVIANGSVETSPQSSSVSARTSSYELPTSYQNSGN
jgi:tetratricopeptide (TPR) repeat protein